MPRQFIDRVVDNLFAEMTEAEMMSGPPPARARTLQLPNRPLRPSRFPVPRVLTYPEVRSERIDADAQRSLLRMSRVVASSADAAGMADEVRLGRLGGIFAQDQQVPALRAQQLGLGWWQLLQPGQDAALVLDPEALQPDALQAGSPIIVFRPAIRSIPERLDAALRAAWVTYQFLRSGRARLCPPGVPGRPLAAAPLSGVMPPVLCKVETPPGNRPCRIEMVSVWLNAFLPPSGLVRVAKGPHAGKIAIRDQTRFVRGGPITSCLLTQNRDFSGDPAAESLFQARVDVNVAGPGAIQRVRSDRLVRLNCDTGEVQCETPPNGSNLSRLKFSDLERDRRTGAISFTMHGQWNHPCSQTPLVILYSIDVFIDLRDNQQIALVRAAGAVREFPAYEIWASADGGPAGFVQLFETRRTLQDTPKQRDFEIGSVVETAILTCADRAAGGPARR